MIIHNLDLLRTIVSESSWQDLVASPEALTTASRKTKLFSRALRPRRVNRIHARENVAKKVLELADVQRDPAAIRAAVVAALREWR